MVYRSKTPFESIIESADPDTRPTVYLASNVAEFGGQKQLMAIAALEVCGYRVVRPDTLEHQAGYQKRGMEHFMDVVRRCDALAYIPFDDGYVGAGVAKEILEALVGDKVVYRMVDGAPMRTWAMPGNIRTVEETRKITRLLREKLTTPAPSPDVYRGN